MACFIDGVIRQAMAINPDNACERCEPGTSTSSWSSQPDGTTCAGDEVCSGRNCQAKCFIDGALVAPNQVNPADPCQQCNPSISTSAWSTLADGSTCGAGQICEATSCVSKCLISGTLYAADAVNPVQACEQCKPADSTNSWTMRASVPLLIGGQPLAAQGWLVVSQAPFTLTTGADDTRLATSTNGGAPTSGQLLITRAGVVDAGVPFTLRAELQVESASLHNLLDSGAAILAAFTPPFGTGTERNAMVYLDPAAIGWADNTQSAPLAITNGLYRTYLFSVDATNTARVSVDGVPLLTRTGFVSNGTFAFGDQSNDPNVDGVMRIRSVDLLCP